MYKSINIAVFLTVLLNLVAGCKKLVDVDGPVTSTNSSIVYRSDENATAVLTDIYSKMSSQGITFGFPKVSLLSSLSSDELVLFDGVTNITYLSYYKNELSPGITGLEEAWTPAYQIIYITNAAIEGIEQSLSITSSTKQQLIGEAKFIRALCYFYLLNLYGDVPLNITTDYKANSQRARTPMSDVYKQIVLDLKDAKSLLSKDYKNAAMSNVNERTRPNKYAAVALLSRVYLFMGEYVNAEAEASEIIDNKALYDTVGISDVFLKNSKETIWALQPVYAGSLSNTSEGRLFILSDAMPPSESHPFFLRNSFVNSFDPSDKRRSGWIGTYVDNTTTPSIEYYFPYKYKVPGEDVAVKEYSIVLRLSEQYLIRAEARVKKGDIINAKSDINVIRNRAGLTETIASNPDDLLTAIYNERRFEFFTEWGHRWLDLKRSNMADNILKDTKGSSWQTTDQLYPIPQSEINGNPAIRDHQNPGYN